MVYFDSMVLEQIGIFLESSALGFGLALTFDIYRAFRLQHKRARATILFLGDLLFWVFPTILALWVIFTFRWGEVHLYTYAGLAAGSGLYFITLSRFLLRAWRRFFGFCFHWLHRFGHAVRRAAAMLYSPFHRLAAGFKSFNVAGALGRIFKSRERN